MKPCEIDKVIENFEHMRRLGIEGWHPYYKHLLDYNTALACLREARERVPILKRQKKCKEHIGRRMNYFCPFCGFQVMPIPREGQHDDLQDYTDTPEAWAKRRVDGQLSGNSEQVKEASDDKT